MSADPQAELRQAMASLREGRSDVALSRLRTVADPHAPFALQNACARVARALAPTLGALPAIRVAVLAGSTVDPLIDALRVSLLLAGFRLDAYNAPFDAWRQQAADPDSGLYRFRPDIVWFFLTSRDLRLLDTQDPANADAADAATLHDVTEAARQVLQRCPVPVFVNNAEPSALRVLGHLEPGLGATRAARIARHNTALAAALPAGASVFDLAHEAACFGLHRFEDARLWYHSKHACALEAYGPLGFAGARLIVASRGRSRKCIVVDLDNTLWGGIVGDDGPDGVRLGASGGAVGEAFVAFQHHLKALAARGVALAVCSKNDDALAREPFRLRSEMVLGLDDFAVFRANWSNKADNLRDIARTMNIGTDALVFVDDNPAERAQVRAELPEVAVVELPDDPSGYVRALAAGRWFETLSMSDEDRGRSRAYRDNALREEALAGASDISTYLRDLEMHATWGLAEPARMARMAQLINKTNQFQLTDRRYAEAELAALAADPAHWVAWFTLRDRFGDHGLISVLVARTDGATAHIDAWAMSCRVFSRRLEDLAFQVLGREMQARGCSEIIGRYVPSAKNGVVSELYPRLGGQAHGRAAAGARWRFPLPLAATPDGVFITETRASGESSNRLNSTDKATP